MTPEQMRDLLTTTAAAMQSQAAGAPIEADAVSGRVSRRESTDAAADLVRYFETLPLGDPRLVTVAQRFPRVDDWVRWAEDDLPDEGHVPAEGSAMLDWLHVATA
jgi:hypothetical protein